MTSHAIGNTHETSGLLLFKDSRQRHVAGEKFSVQYNCVFVLLPDGSLMRDSGDDNRWAEFRFSINHSIFLLLTGDDPAAAM